MQAQIRIWTRQLSSKSNTRRQRKKISRKIEQFEVELAKRKTLALLTENPAYLEYSEQQMEQFEELKKQDLTEELQQNVMGELYRQKLTDLANKRLKDSTKIIGSTSHRMDAMRYLMGSPGILRRPESLIKITSS